MNKLIIAGMVASGFLGYNIKEDGTRVEKALENVKMYNTLKVGL